MSKNQFRLWFECICSVSTRTISNICRKISFDSHLIAFVQIGHSNSQKKFVEKSVLIWFDCICSVSTPEWSLIVDSHLSAFLDYHLTFKWLPMKKTLDSHLVAFIQFRHKNNRFPYTFDSIRSVSTIKFSAIFIENSI